MISLHTDISVQPDKLNLPHPSFKKQTKKPPKTTKIQKATQKKPQNQNKTPQKPHTLIPRQKWGQNKRTELQKYPLAKQTCWNNACFPCTTLQHHNKMSLMSLLPIPGLSASSPQQRPASWPPNMPADHQTWPGGCSPAAVASRSVRLSPTQWPDTRRAGRLLTGMLS